MKDMTVEEILDKAKEMQEQFQQMQQMFGEKKIMAMAGIEDPEQSYVKVTIDGTRMVKALDIGQGVWKQEKKVGVDLIITAINSATDKLNGEMQKEVQKIYEAPKEPSHHPKLINEDN